MKLSDLYWITAISEANRPVSAADAQGCGMMLLPMIWEFLGAAILGGFGAAFIVMKYMENGNPLISLGLIAGGGIGAFFLYRYIHVLAQRFLPLKIVTILLSGFVWTGVLWYVLPRTQELRGLSLIVFIAACFWKRFNMKVRAEEA